VGVKMGFFHTFGEGRVGVMFSEYFLQRLGLFSSSWPGARAWQKIRLGLIFHLTGGKTEYNLLN
jgi:hypothetical protein